MRSDEGEAGKLVKCALALGLRLLPAEGKADVGIDRPDDLYGCRIGSGVQFRRAGFQRNADGAAPALRRRRVRGGIATGIEDRPRLRALSLRGHGRATGGALERDDVQRLRHGADAHFKVGQAMKRPGDDHGARCAKGDHDSPGGGICIRAKQQEIATAPI